MDAAKSRAKTIVIIEWILFVILSALVVGAIAIFFSMDNQSKKSFVEEGYGEDPVPAVINPEKFAEVLMYLLGVSILFSLIFNVILTYGVYKERSTWCKVWYIINIVGIVFQILDFLKTLVSFSPIAIFIHGIGLGYRIYAVKTIIQYTNELKLYANPTPGVIYTAAAAGNGTGQPGYVYSPPPSARPSAPPSTGFIYGNPDPPPPAYEDVTKNAPPWNNYHNSNYP